MNISILLYIRTCRHRIIYSRLSPYLKTHGIKSRQNIFLQGILKIKTLPSKLLTYLLTYLLLLENLTVSQVVKKFSAFYGTQSFINTFTSARNCPYPETARSSSRPHNPIPEYLNILILSSHPRLVLTSGLFPSDFPTKTLYTPLLSPYKLHAPPVSLFSILSPEQYWVSSTDH
jgi:hypothetical protein